MVLGALKELFGTLQASALWGCLRIRPHYCKMHPGQEIQPQNESRIVKSPTFVDFVSPEWGCNIRSLVLIVIRTEFLYNSVFGFWALGLQTDEFGPDGSGSAGLPLLPFLFLCLSLSFFSSHPYPPRFYSFHFPSTHSVCVLLINTSLCLPAGVSDTGHS